MKLAILRRRRNQERSWISGVAPNVRFGSLATYERHLCPL